MHWAIQTSLSAIAAFAATNVDDLVILMLFFAQAHQHRPDRLQQLQPRQIVLGQYAGFVALLLASIPGYLGGIVIPKPWVGLSGILPIIIGIRAFWQDADDVETATPNEKAGGWQRWGDPQIMKVAAVTFANGGDNIGIYVPLFAKSNLPQLVLTVLIFLSLVAVWCGVAYRLTRQPHIALVFNRFAHRSVPFVLIGLGLYIFLESGSQQLFGLGK
jgi:cadmium resistance transport/sequestration family protein